MFGIYRFWPLRKHLLADVDPPNRDPQRGSGPAKAGPLLGPLLVELEFFAVAFG
jgi:hypothetical protein